VYLSTGLYVSSKQVNVRTFEIKDQFILERTNSTIREYERYLISYSTLELASMPVEVLKSSLLSLSGRIDYFAFCDKLIKDNPAKTAALRFSLSIIKNEMGITSMSANEFTSRFIREFKQTLDTRDVITKRSDGTETRRKMSQKTKRGYLVALCSSFKRMKEYYNTEFYQRITHDPLINVEHYKEPVTKKRSMPVEHLLLFFSYKSKLVESTRAVDVMRLSFGLCGINVIDIYTMHKSCYDPITKRITYNRRKTKSIRADNALSSIRIEPEIEDVFNKYLSKSGDLLFDFGISMSPNSFSRKICMNVASVCKQLKLPSMSPYWFRHTWATIARNKCGVSKDDIDLCLNHTGNNPMADVYIDYDWSVIDRANRKVLDYVFHNNRK
jgi:integrase